MPFYVTLLFGFLKALVMGDFKRQWQEHQEKEADNVENKVNSLSGADRVSELRKWTKPE